MILTGDFHLSTQLVGADTAEFYPALSDESAGIAIAGGWSRTARRLFTDFRTSVGLVNGKRCLGGMLELMMHCHFLIAVEDAALGMPEVTLPVVPGMEGCHWPFRKAPRERWSAILTTLLGGRPVAAREAAGWLVDFAGPLDAALATAWAVASGGSHTLRRRDLEHGPLAGAAEAVPELAPAGDPGLEAGRRAILETVRASTSVSLDEALEVQARHSGGFMTTAACRRGVIGTAYERTMLV